jgi:hypothetical protein
VARTSRMRQLVTWLALATSLGADRLLVMLRVATPSDGARVAFYGDDWSAEGVTIRPIDAPAPGLEAGDMVRAVADRTVDAWLAAVADPAVARPSPGAPIAYLLERDAVAQTVDVASMMATARYL